MKYKNLSDIYDNRYNINPNRLFYEYFKELPYVIKMYSDSPKSLYDSLIRGLEYEPLYNSHEIYNIGSYYTSEIFISKSEKIIFVRRSTSQETDEARESEEAVDEDINNASIDIYYLPCSRIDNLLKSFSNMEKVNKPENDIGFVLESNNRLYISRRKLKLSYKDTNLQIHYNDGFVDFDRYLRECLTDYNRNGIIILRGLPGTGKSSYLKNLLATCPTKFVFFPVGLLKSVETSPSIMSFFIENGQEDTCYIVEDAENVVQSDDSGRPNGLSTLLNFSDSIVSDVFRCKFILTFNKDNVWENMDEAILRKGRLLAEYKFDNLTLEKTKELFLDIHKKDYEGKVGLSLANIYNYFDEFGSEKKEDRKRVGFL